MQAWKGRMRGPAYAGHVDRKLIMVNGKRYHFAVEIRCRGRPGIRRGPGREASRVMPAAVPFGQMARAHPSCAMTHSMHCFTVLSHS
jgi:hypothetical protein